MASSDAAVTNDALSKGTDWECARCGGQWNATRLATAAAYALWLFGYNNAAGGACPDLNSGSRTPGRMLAYRFCEFSAHHAGRISH